MATVTLRMFASAREAARCTTDTVEAASLGEALGIARDRYGADFAAVFCRRLWMLMYAPRLPNTGIADVSPR